MKSRLHGPRGIAPICVLVGLTFWLYWQGARDQANARIERLGGSIIVDNEGKKDQVASVVLIARPVHDADLSFLKDSHDFQRVFLDSTYITDEGLRHLENMSQLEVLGLGNCRITDEGLKHLRDLNRLHTLNLDSCSITDDGLGHLKTLENLKCVCLQFTKVSRAGIADLKKTFPNLLVLTTRNQAQHPAPK